MAKRPDESDTTGDAKREKPLNKIWVDGCFDMFHFGHANALRQAKLLGDYLVVGVHNDAEVKIHKGCNPVMTEVERYAAVEACRWVDEVVRDAPYTTELSWMDKYGCQYAAHGDDIATAADGRDAYEAVKEAGRFKVYPRTTGVSTTDLVGRMLLLAKEPSSEPASPSTHANLEDMASGSCATKKSPYTALSKFVATTKRIVEFTGDRRAPRETDKIIYMDGAFDLFNVGHIEGLKLARSFGDYLIVGLLDDETVTAQRGRNHPLMNLQERVLSVLQCKYVDEVVMGSPYHLTEQFILDMNISLVVTGSVHEVDSDSGQDPYAAAKKLGRFQGMKSPLSLTAHDIVRRIFEHRMEYEERNRKKEAKELALLHAQEAAKAAEANQ